MSPDDVIVTVRRQWNDWREATYRLSDIRGLHWTDLSGGVNAVAPRAFIHGYVWCDRMIAGELAHSCEHGKGPHEIKVCLVKKQIKPFGRKFLQRWNSAVQSDRWYPTIGRLVPVLVLTAVTVCSSPWRDLAITQRRAS